LFGEVCSQLWLGAGLLNRCGLDPQLQFSLGSAIELLVDSRVLAIKLNIAAGAVGITFKDDVNIFGNAKELAEILGKRASSELSQRKLEASSIFIVEHFDGDERTGAHGSRCGCRRSHGVQKDDCFFLLLWLKFPSGVI
jgi:hypothetical protein